MPGAPAPPPERVRLTRAEVVGAWLRLWTPPRDAVVPPVPWRGLAIAGALTALALGGLATYAVPRISDSKRERSELEAARARVQAAAERRRLVREMRPMRARAPRPAGRLGRAAELRARREVLDAVRAAITADARRRAAAGELSGRALRTECVPAPRSVPRAGAEVDPRRAADGYDCIAVTRDIAPGRRNPAGRLGHPFRAIVDFARGTFVWCRTIPLPGEAATPDPRGIPLLPRACRLRR
jgi:hypothetical protein